VNAFVAQLPSLVALAAHVAICVTGVSVVGVAALWFCRSASAPTRHALAFGLLLATLVVPPVAALYQYRLIRLHFAAAPKPLAAVTEAVAPQSGGMMPLSEKPESAAGQQHRGPSWTFIASAIFATIWAIGFLALVVRTLLANRRQRQHLASLRPVADKYPLALFARLRRTLGIRRNVQLLTSREVPWPFTVGVFRPRIVVPTELLQGLLRDRLEAVLLHELAHVRRGDCAIAAIEQSTQLVYWWNPFVSTISYHLGAAREEICDAYVLNHCDGGIQLADYLLRSCQNAAHFHVQFGVGLSSHSTYMLRRRITRLLAVASTPTISSDSRAIYLLIAGAQLFSIAFVHVNYARAQLMLGTPLSLGPIVNSMDLVDADPEISADGLTLYFMRGTGRADVSNIVATSRETLKSAWQTPVVVHELTAQGVQPSRRSGPTVTEDELLMFFYGQRADDRVDYDIYQSTRASKSDSWGAPVNIGAPVNSQFNDRHPSISADGLSLYFSSNRHAANPTTGGEDLDIYVAERTSRTEPFGSPTRLAINSERNDAGADVSSDGLLLVFHSRRNSTPTEDHQGIFYSERETKSDPWGPAKLLGVSSMPWSQASPSISANRSHLYFLSATNNSDSFASSDLFVVEIVQQPSKVMMMAFGCVLLSAFKFGRRL
jgi:beta-lactamase regulating signal transducer with metallopeptidase domain/Tol biopolymer transport system component